MKKIIDNIDLIKTKSNKNDNKTNHDKSNIVYYDKDGKLRNTHLFSEVAQFKLKHGVYTFAQEGTTEYDKFWDRETDRCLNGYQVGEVRVTGYNYFFLNYHRLEIVVDPSSPSSDKILSFPRFWRAHFDFFNLVEYAEKHGKHFALVKARGTGLSECASSMGARDFAIYPAKKEDRDKMRLKKDFYFGSHDTYLFNDGVVDKVWDNINFLNTDTAFDHQLQIKNKEDHKIAGYISQSKTIATPIQTGGEVSGTIVDKVDKVRGKRGYKIFYEEAGTFKDLEAAFNITRPLVEQGGVVTGTIMVWGTSNEKDEYVAGLKNMIYSPDGYRLLKFRNVWKNGDVNEIPSSPLDYIIEDNNKNSEDDLDESYTGWFIPVYECMDKFMDKDGNPDREAAKKYHEEERQKLLKNISYEKYRVYMADHPFTIEEALTKTSTEYFNAEKLTEQYGRVKLIEKRLNIEKGNLEWIIDNNTGSAIGCRFVKSETGKVTILEHPTTINGGIPDNLYIAGVDSIDFGESNSSGNNNSKFAMVVKKRTHNLSDKYNNTYVAYIKYRPYDERDAYELALKLSWYYNCKINLEMTRKEIISYFRQPGKNLPNQEFRFSARAKLLENTLGKKTKVGAIGTPADVKTVAHLNSLVKSYIQDHVENIFFVEMLEELKDFSPNNRTKYDLTVAIGLAELLDSELDYLGKRVKIQEGAKAKIHLYGYYRDSYGNIHYGKLPNENETFELLNVKREGTIQYIDRTSPNSKIVRSSSSVYKSIYSEEFLTPEEYDYDDNDDDFY